MTKPDSSVRVAALGHDRRRAEPKSRSMTSPAARLWRRAPSPSANPSRAASDRVEVLRGIGRDVAVSRPA
ncbi:hypothetical protein ABZU76_44680 [Amycolatopsis sp. NPDC005232]|uniref:hypothetical protein n=1 Tax=Amycolatopsis sp. NPDC005232 TaxID=3157027 RepID=UPI0033BDE1F6